MTLELLRKNIEQEKILVKRMEMLVDRETLLPEWDKNKKIYQNAIVSTTEQIRILNNSIPGLLKNIEIVQPLKEVKKPEEIFRKEEVIAVQHKIEGLGDEIAIRKKDKRAYLEQLQISERSLKEIKKKKKEEEGELFTEYKKPRAYVKISNKFFGRIANNLVDKGYMKDLKGHLKKANFSMILNSYVAMMLFTTFIAFFVGLFLVLLFMFIGFTTEPNFFYLVDFSEIDVLMRLIKLIWLAPLMPCLTFLAFYYYPSAEKASLERKIEYELPFAAIQMAAIAGANIEPSNIFRIISISKDYPTIRNEAKKLMNQINLYGYDLVTALKNVSDATPSRGFADLLNGISATVRSGGDLSKYLNKKSESLLFEYRLRREKATKNAETFMDIYISVVIAAPMLMMLLLVLINISGFGINLPINILTLIIVSIVSTINIVFLIFLHLSQRKL